MQLYVCVQALSDSWKTHFSLGTNYAGYFTPEMALSLISVFRYSERKKNIPSEAKEIIAFLNEEIFQIKRLHQDMDYIEQIPNNSDVESVISELMVVMKNYDAAIVEPPKEQWDLFIEYLKGKLK